MILPHEFVPGLIQSYQGKHCQICGYVEPDSIHRQERQQSIAFGLTATAEAEVIPGNAEETP